MDKKYLKAAFDQNQMAIEKVVNTKTATLRSEIETMANHVYLIFDELCVAEQNLTLVGEEINDEGKKFNFTYFFLILIVPVIYFIDLLLSQDAVSYLLPATIEDGSRVFFCYLVPALFVIADLGLGLVRHKIKTDLKEGRNDNVSMLYFINATGFAFCLILPMLVGATILAFTESSDIASSEITARIALMLLSFILHYFVIFLFPKNAFDYCIGYSSYNSCRNKVQKKEKEIYKKISELSIAVLNYKAKSDQHQFVQKIDKIEFSFNNRLLINQIAKTDAWVQQLEMNEKLQHLINENEFLNRFFQYRPMPIIEVKEEVPAPLVVEVPVAISEKPKGIYITYVQNDSSVGYSAN